MEMFSLEMMWMDEGRCRLTCEMAVGFVATVTGQQHVTQF